MTQIFAQYALPEYLHEALRAIGFVQPTDIQQAVIPLALRGKHVIGQAQTGSGKSHSFLLPLLAQVNPNHAEVQLVVTAPSRELAAQLHQVTTELTAFSPEEIRVGLYVGGTDKQRHLAKLAHTQPHVVIGTPGRLLDLMKEQALHLYTATMLVVDEADMTLDMGFLSDVDAIASRISKEAQLLVFSATIPPKLQPFLQKYLHNPVFIDQAPKNLLAPTITNQLVATKGQALLPLVHQVLTIGQPYLAMVFANTKQQADEVATYLRERGLRVAVLHGDVPARERKRVLKHIQQLDYQYVVATDLAARGIDIEGVSLVVNLSVPKERDFFIHRVGRTGRNGLPGLAITFYTPDDDQAIRELEQRGVVFEAVALKEGVLVPTHDRNRRMKREKTTPIVPDSRVRGMVKKAKQTVKPGYKRKLQEQIKRHERRMNKRKP